jgi:hypothetical protein
MGHTFLALILVKLRPNWFSNCCRSSVEHVSNPSPKSFLQIIQVFSCLLQQISNDFRRNKFQNEPWNLLETSRSSIFLARVNVSSFTGCMQNQQLGLKNWPNKKGNKMELILSCMVQYIQKTACFHAQWRLWYGQLFHMIIKHDGQ